VAATANGANARLGHALHLAGEFQRNVTVALVINRARERHGQGPHGCGQRYRVRQPSREAKAREELWPSWRHCFMTWQPATITPTHLIGWWLCLSTPLSVNAGSSDHDNRSTLRLDRFLGHFRARWNCCCALKSVCDSLKLPPSWRGSRATYLTVCHSGWAPSFSAWLHRIATLIPPSSISSSDAPHTKSGVGAWRCQCRYAVTGRTTVAPSPVPSLIQSSAFLTRQFSAWQTFRLLGSLREDGAHLVTVLASPPSSAFADWIAPQTICRRGRCGGLRGEKRCRPPSTYTADFRPV
jgi:hypothetical protein